MWWWLGFFVFLAFSGWGLLSAWRLLSPLPLTLSPPDAAAPWTQHTVIGPHGDAIPVWQMTAQHAKGVILVCHGYFANRYQILGIALRLSRLDYEVLAMELRGHGVRPGPCTLGLREADDADAILQWAAEQPGLGALPVGVLGLSMGAAVVSQVAARDSRVRAIVADSLYSRLFPVLCRALWQRRYLPAIPWAWGAWWGLRLICHRRLSQVDPLYLAPRMAQPLLMIHGGGDRRVPRRLADEVYDRWAGPKERWDEPEVGHVGTFASDPDRYAARVADFFGRTLR